MLVDYCWTLRTDVLLAKYGRKSSTVTFYVMYILYIMLRKYSLYSKFSRASLKILPNNKFEMSAKILFDLPTLVRRTKN